jgi:hypothetical protein
MTNARKTTAVVTGLVLAFIALAAAFAFEIWGRPTKLYDIPLVDPSFLGTEPARVSYAELVRKKEDLSDFDCYGCHEKGKPPPIRYDTNHNIIIPKEHANIVLGHGRHNRNNNCFNCHDENNLERFQTRDKHDLGFAESTPLCGSCHGPTYRDWEAGVHGRTSGYWALQAGGNRRLDCVECHNPHSPKFAPRKPAPGPHPLRLDTTVSAKKDH